jgi:hypothetical protein
MKKKRKTKEERSYDKLVDNCFSDLEKYQLKHKDKSTIPYRIQIFTAINSLFDFGYDVNKIKQVFTDELKLAKDFAIERIEGKKH